MEFLKLAGSLWRKVANAIMVSISAYQTAMHVVALAGLVAYVAFLDPTTLTAYKAGVVLAVAVGLLVGWKCIARFAHEERFIALVGLLLAWGVCAVAVGSSPMMGKSGARFRMSRE